MARVTSVVVVGGGPGGYESALVAAQEGADVTLVERDGPGGAAVLTDCVPSKTLIATTEAASRASRSARLGVLYDGSPLDRARMGVDLDRVNQRVRALAEAQSEDIGRKLQAEGITVLSGHAVVRPGSRVEITEGRDRGIDLAFDQLLLAPGARPRELAGAETDGERILNWKQVWNLTVVPERLIVVGSGVTGAEFAGAFVGIGAEVILVSSRGRVLPTQDADGATVVEEVFTRRGMRVMGHSRAVAVARDGEGVVVTLKDGSRITGSHCLMAVGIVPNTDRMGLPEAGIKLAGNGTIEVDRVSRTNVMGVYAAGDATGVMALASVAAMQGRIAMWHALGDAVEPLDLTAVSSAVFTDPEIAAVGVPADDIESGRVAGRIQFQPLAPNPRAKMQGVSDGFVKLMVSPDGTVIGGVIVAPHASDLIHVVAVAVRRRLTVDDIAGSYSVYPSMSGSIGEAARRLHQVAG